MQRIDIADPDVQMGAGLVSRLGDLHNEVTLEIWVKCAGGFAHQHIFDFGFGNGQSATSFCILEPANAAGRLNAICNFTSAPDDYATGDWAVVDNGPMDCAAVRHVAVTFNGTRLRLYQDGIPVDSFDAAEQSLSSIDDRHSLVRPFAVHEGSRVQGHSVRVQDLCSGFGRCADPG